MKRINTPKNGQVRYIVFKEKDVWYAVALEFNIVVDADSEILATINLFDAIKGYVEAVNKIKGTRVTPLNQDTDAEYESMWKDINSDKIERKIKFPFVNNYGVINV